jgi:predicted nicotinamide N-methyase
VLVSDMQPPPQPPPPPPPPLALQPEGKPAVEIELRLDDETSRVFPVWEDVHEGGPGGRLWDAAVLLAQHLAERVGQDSLRGKTVVELGAGVGLPGIVAAVQGAHVTLTVRAVLLTKVRVWKASKAEPRQRQDWILKCLQGG